MKGRGGEGQDRGGGERRELREVNTAHYKEIVTDREKVRT